MSTLIITRGLPASGKTTWARKWVTDDPANRVRVNRDDFRAMMFDAPTYQWEQERLVTEASRDAVRALLKAGIDVVADDMNLRPKYVREWQRFARANGADLEVVEFPIDPDEAIRRDAVRDRVVGEEAIRRMVAKFMPKGEFLPIPAEVERDDTGAPYEPPEDGIPAVMVDIDGTIALHGDRSPYDLSRVGDDHPNEAVIAAVEHAEAAGMVIIYCSGREDSCREDTSLWIRENAPGGLLFMRAADDNRKDSIVKRELFDANIRHTYDVKYVLDDRKQVVDMWRSLGLTVLQVAEGDF